MPYPTKALAPARRRYFELFWTQTALLAAAAGFVFVLIASYGVDLSPGLF